MVLNAFLAAVIIQPARTGMDQSASKSVLKTNHIQINTIVLRVLIIIGTRQYGMEKRACRARTTIRACRTGMG